MPGPPPNPTEYKRLRGNPGHQKLPAPAVVIEGAIDHVPDPPDGLGAEGKRRWSEVWGVADKWLVQQLDLSLLIRYCEAHDERAAYRALVRKEGRISRGSTGQPKVHPAVEQIERIDAAMLRMEDALGFHPVSRARLHVEKRAPKEERKLDRFIRAG